MSKKMRNDGLPLLLKLPAAAIITQDKGGDGKSFVDTIVHEAVHSTIRHLGRLPRTPEPDEAIASYGEEVVALAGANLILRKIKFSARREIARNMIALANCKTVLGRLGCSEQFLRDRLTEAELAADFLTDFGIDVAAPTLEEIQSRSSRE